MNQKSFIMKSNFILWTIGLIIFTSCSTKKSQEQESKDNDQTTSDINVYPAPPSPDYEGASLTLEALPSDLDTGDINFNFSVSNYELGVQTEDAATRGIANSGKGQHIHFILNNGPYSAHYEPSFSKNFKEGNYVLLAFLSRSYHESVKNDQSSVITSFTVGSPAEELDFDPNGQHLFFSRPKGTYSGADTEKVMLDFFLYNTSISADGNKVKLTVNEETLMLEEWVPYYIEGLEKGEVTLKIELVDNQGNLIPGPFNSTERSVTLE